MVHAGVLCLHIKFDYRVLQGDRRGRQFGMSCLRPIVERADSLQIRERSARFLQDHVGRRKIPVAALAAGKRRLQAAMRDPAQPKRQRPDSGVKHRIAGRGVEPFDQRLRTGDAGKIQLRA